MKIAVIWAWLGEDGSMKRAIIWLLSVLQYAPLYSIALLLIGTTPLDPQSKVLQYCHEHNISKRCNTLSCQALPHFRLIHHHTVSLSYSISPYQWSPHYCLSHTTLICLSLVAHILSKHPIHATWHITEALWTHWTTNWCSSPRSICLFMIVQTRSIYLSGCAWLFMCVVWSALLAQIISRQL